MSGIAFFRPNRPRSNKTLRLSKSPRSPSKSTEFPPVVPADTLANNILYVYGKKVYIVSTRKNKMAASKRVQSKPKPVYRISVPKLKSIQEIQELLYDGTITNEQLDNAIKKADPKNTGQLYYKQLHSIFTELDSLLNAKERDSVRLSLGSLSLSPSK